MYEVKYLYVAFPDQLVVVHKKSELLMAISALN